MTDIKDVELDWCIWVGESQQDFIMDMRWIDDLPELYNQDQEIYTYDQWKTPHCTLYSAFGAVSDLFNYRFTQNEIDEMVEESYRRWRVRWKWWYVKSAVELVADYRNEHHSNLWKVAYYRLDLRDDALVDKILSKNYTLCSWFQWNGAYNKDRIADNILDWYNFGTPKTYWHAVSWIKRNWKRYIKDNYCNSSTANWVDYNIYEVKPLCSQEVSWWTYFVWAYLYTKVSEDNFERLKNIEKMKSLSLVAQEAHSALWGLSNSDYHKNKMHEFNEFHRWWTKEMDEQLKKLS